MRFAGVHIIDKGSLYHRIPVAENIRGLVMVMCIRRVVFHHYPSSLADEIWVLG